MVQKVLTLLEKLEAGWETVHTQDSKTSFWAELLMPPEEAARVSQDQAVSGETQRLENQH